jgi:hypothetical protein
MNRFAQKYVLYLIFFIFVFRLEMGRDKKSIVNAHRIQYEAKAPERVYHIAQACTSYAARHPELMEEIYNSDVEANCS